MTEVIIPDYVIVTEKVIGCKVGNVYKVNNFSKKDGNTFVHFSNSTTGFNIRFFAAATEDQFNDYQNNKS